MSKSRYPFHLRSFQSSKMAACGVFDCANLQRRSIKRVTCTNCLKIIERNVATRYFQPSPTEGDRESN